MYVITCCRAGDMWRTAVQPQHSTLIHVLVGQVSNNQGIPLTAESAARLVEWCELYVQHNPRDNSIKSQLDKARGLQMEVCARKVREEISLLCWHGSYAYYRMDKLAAVCICKLVGSVAHFVTVRQQLHNLEYQVLLVRLILAIANLSICKILTISTHPPTFAGARGSASSAMECSGAAERWLGSHDAGTSCTQCAPQQPGAELMLMHNLSSCTGLEQRAEASGQCSLLCCAVMVVDRDMRFWYVVNMPARSQLVC